MKIYVAGAMEHDLFGINRRRRRKINAALVEMGHEILDPIDTNLEIDQELKRIKPTKGSNKYSGFVRLIVENDLRLVSEADLVFVIYSRGVRKGAGTHGEITYAASLMKPIVIWSPWHKIKKIPGWIFGCCHPRFMNKKIQQSLEDVNLINNIINTGDEKTKVPRRE